MAKEQKKLCILGTASSMKEAPFEDESFEIWGMAGLIEDDDCKRLDKAFEMHPRRHWGQLPVLMRLNKFSGEIYMQDHYEEIPNSVRFPIEEIREEFHLPVMGENLYVTNTITWQILLGLHEGFRDFAIFGVHMAHDTEYAYQLPSCSWALGLIHGKMLAGEPYTLHLPEQSSLLKARYEYGYKEPSELMVAIDQRVQGLKAGVDKTSKEMADLQQARFKTEGALQEARHWYDYVAGHR